MEPLQLNGVLEKYLLDWGDGRMEVRNFTSLSALLVDLVPYTEYSVVVAACTSKYASGFLELFFRLLSRNLGFVSHAKF